MSNLTFPFFGVTSDAYPESSLKVRFGRGYSFATGPRGPDQIITTVKFPKGMFWFEDPVTRQMDHNVWPSMNVGALMDLYEAVRCWDIFNYNHPIRGNTVWRFSKPLVIPELTDDPGAVGGYGGYRVHQTIPFQVELELQP